jgi:peptidoglycan DL-endopeptidase CwlO
MSVVQFRWKSLLAWYYILVAPLLLVGDAVSAAPNNILPVSSQVVASSLPQSPGGFAFGSGTYYVARRRSVSPHWGNARSWVAHAQADGYAVGTRPLPGAIAWTDTRNFLGRVAYVEKVMGDRVLVSEMGYNGGWNRVTFRIVPANAFLYIY